MHKQLDEGFLLHSQPFKETSLLMNVFTKDNGRINMVANGAKRLNYKKRGLLQAFVPITVEWVGKRGLVTLKQVESRGYFYELKGKNLMNGLYVNELLIRFLSILDPHKLLFLEYQSLVKKLSIGNCQENTLRLFEKSLLKYIGYEVNLKYDSNMRLLKEGYYYDYHPEIGPILTSKKSKPYLFFGKDLLDIHNNKIDSPNLLYTSKRLITLVIDFHLGNKPLRSRELL